MRGVNKGVGVNKLLERFGEVNFVLCVGLVGAEGDFNWGMRQP